MRKSKQEQKVFSSIKEKKLFFSKDKVLVAVSGGFDSVVLFDILIKLKNELDIDLAIAHVNYNLRGKDSLDEEIYVKKLASDNLIPFYLISIDPQKELYDKNSLEDNARNIRYSFFEKIANENNYNKIAIAHNADDQAETVLLNLIRGSVSGLKGIEFIRNFSETNTNLKVVRPLLTLSRNEIEEYCITFNLNPKTDKSNLSDDYKRNRIRHNLIPLIKEENPNFLENIINTSTVIREENLYLQEVAKEHFEKSLIEKNNSYLVISYNQIKDLPDLIKRRIIKEAFFNISKTSKSISFNRIEAIIKCLNNNESGKTIELIEDYLFKKDRDFLVFMKGDIYKTFNAYYQNCSINLEDFEKIKSKKINLLNTEILISEVSGVPEKFDSKKYIYFSLDFGNKEINLDFYSYKKDLLFNNFGSNKDLNLKLFYDKQKIPELLRYKTPIIYINNKIMWLLGLYRSNNLKIDSTKKIYKLELLQNCDKVL